MKESRYRESPSERSDRLRAQGVEGCPCRFLLIRCIRRHSDQPLEALGASAGFQRVPKTGISSVKSPPRKACSYRGSSSPVRRVGWLHRETVARRDSSGRIQRQQAQFSRLSPCRSVVAKKRSEESLHIIHVYKRWRQGISREVPHARRIRNPMMMQASAT